ESRLDTRRFVRVHRSHIVNIERVVAMKRTGESGVIEMAAFEPYTVPVSRGRFTSLRSRLAATTDEADDAGDAVAVAPTFAAQHR
ncbi:MAG TPA: LytTR family DNA-binding domain-containing protein, partial [Sinorhizobium sp.]|nr:LytTR family DNA-binding domain-containing protein [Sinorhizobium sp.]